MELTKYQMQALLDFEEYGYVIIEAPRGSGKTVFLREIIKRNIGKEKIGIVCSSLSLYRACYEREFNKKITYIPRVMFIDGHRNSQFTLLIGDEIFIEPCIGIKTACVLTRDYFVHHWNLENVPFMNSSKINTLKNSLSKEMFRTLTGLSI